VNGINSSKNTTQQDKTMKDYTNFYCNYCKKLKGLPNDHSKCSKELQKLKWGQTKAAKGTRYQSDKQVTKFLKLIGAE
jgi:hypothetical protein